MTQDKSKEELIEELNGMEITEAWTAKRLADFILAREQAIKAENERYIQNMAQDREYIDTLKDRIGELEEEVKKGMRLALKYDALEKKEATLRKRVLDELSQYLEHDVHCLSAQCKQGRPTKDGGYERLYGYGKDEKWYRNGEEPKCSCGLNDTIAILREGQ